MCRNELIGNVVMRSLVITVAAFLAACGSGSGSESVSTPPTQTVSSITLTPSAASIQVNQPQQFGATATDITGNPIPGVIFTWASSNQGVATISNSGLATGVSVSSTTITATSGTVTSNQATLTVTTASTGPRGYTTKFPFAENPISESGNWINGGTTGVNWTNMLSTPGLAFGTQPGTAAPPQRYADSTAVLTGTWGANQQAQAVVYNPTPNNGASVFEEVEIRLNSIITANSITGYECNYSTKNDGTQYTQIVRWNGGLGSFTPLQSLNLTTPITTGNIVRCVKSGNTITSSVNYGSGFVTVATATDSTYTGGSPGVGMYLEGTTGVNSDYGFTSFTASDGP